MSAERMSGGDIFPELPRSHFLAHAHSCGHHRPSCRICTASAALVMTHVIHNLRVRAAWASQGRTPVLDNIRLHSLTSVSTAAMQSPCTRTIRLIPFFSKDYTPSLIPLLHSSPFFNRRRQAQGSRRPTSAASNSLPEFSKYIGTLDVPSHLHRRSPVLIPFLSLMANAYKWHFA